MKIRTILGIATLGIQCAHAQINPFPGSVTGSTPPPPTNVMPPPMTNAFPGTPNNFNQVVTPTNNFLLNPSNAVPGTNIFGTNPNPTNPFAPRTMGTNVNRLNPNPSQTVPANGSTTTIIPPNNPPPAPNPPIAPIAPIQRGGIAPHK